MPPIKPDETITTTEPRIEITPTAEVPLPVGTHTFELVVEDDRGQKSRPALFQVTVQRPPEAVLEGPTKPVDFGSSFDLDGSGSSTAENASLIAYHWRRLPGFGDTIVKG